MKPTKPFNLPIIFFGITRLPRDCIAWRRRIKLSPRDFIHIRYRAIVSRGNNRKQLKVFCDNEANKTF